MPRAFIPARLQSIQRRQIEAVALRESASSAAAVADEIAVVADSIPADLTDDLAALADIVANL